LEVLMFGKLMVIVAVALGGCAAQAAPDAAPPEAATSIPIAPLTTAPPNGPTDQIKKTDWLVGTVTKDSSGPCYGMETDEGTQYALHASDGTKLVKGQRMRIKTGPMLVRMYCGPGTPLEMISSVRL
jgi:hypothetical protein